MKFNQDTFRWRENLSRAAWKVISAVQNVKGSFISNDGEEVTFNHFLKTLSSRQSRHPLTIFDVGANVGDYSQMVLDSLLRYRLTGTLHLFEPNPVAFEKLQQRFNAHPQCRLNNLALSDQTGELPFVLSGTEGKESHLALRPSAQTTVAVCVQRLDDYFQEQAITQVDWLKIDVEGAELSVLRGLSDWAQPEKIAVIQFEYDDGYLQSGASLKACWELLESRGYKLARLFSHGPMSVKYKPWLENFSLANYIAVNPALLDR